MRSTKAQSLERPLSITKSLQSFNIKQLFEKLEALRKENTFLKWENDLFEEFIGKHDVFNLLSNSSNISQAEQQQVPRIFFAMIPDKESPGSEAETSDATKGSSGTKIIWNRSQTSARRNMDGALQHSLESTKLLEPKINFTTRIEMAETLYQTLNKRLNCIECETKAKLRELRAQIIEFNFRRAEINQMKNVFTRFVNDNSSKWPKRRLSAEKFIKLLEDCLRRGTTLVEQIRMRNSSQKRQLQRSERLLDKRIELNRTLTPIDFELLQIEKSKNLKKMEEINSKLDFLKRSSHDAFVRLKKQKAFLKETDGFHKNLIRTAKILTERISKYEALIPLAEMDVNACHQKIMDLREEINNFAAPSTIDYFNKKHDLASLEKEKKQLIRQISIGKIKLQNLKQKIKVRVTPLST